MRPFWEWEILSTDQGKIFNRARLAILFVCAFPLFLNLFGVDFGFISNKLDPYRISRLFDFENQRDLQDILRGRYVHTIFVSFSIAVSFLTIILAFIDFRIQHELSTPIVGVALFCSGLFNTFHILVATQILHAPANQFYLTSFTWFFSRMFHASILILGTGIFLVQSDAFRDESRKSARRFVIYISVIFVLLTFFTIAILFQNTDIPQIPYPFRNIARSYDLIPLFLYAFCGLYLLPKFNEKYPSVFSQTLLLSMIPAVATQLYMAFGSNEMFDNDFNISHFMATVTYFIPFIGLSMNYVQTHRNEKRVISELNVEIHEREYVEKTLSKVLDSSLSAIMAFSAIRDQSRKIIDFEWAMANPVTDIFFGVDRNNIRGKRLLDLIPEAATEGWMEIFINVTETNEPANYEYYSEKFKRWFLIVAVKLDDGLAVTISDISKRKDALRELIKSEQLAATGRFSRSIAHEVRNPLTNINLSLEQIRIELPAGNEHASYFLEIIARNSDRINQLIHELLTSSKPIEIRLAPISVKILLDETIELASDRLRLKQITLEKDYPDYAAEIQGDMDKLKTALLNLMINAIEAIESKDGILHIGFSKNENHCEIIIRDNGIGISAENINNLFEPFFSGKKTGTGLGLTTALNIIRSHNGTIEVDSQPGKGTTFLISIPS